MIIYRTTNKINGKQYIGYDTKNNPRYYGSGKLIKRALKKYGKENFIKEIIEDNINDFDLLKQREIHWIKIFNTKVPNGYNLADGGGGTLGYAPLKGKTAEEIYGKERAKELKRQNSERQKGISYEEKHGKEESDRIKKKQSLSLKKLGRKGKTLEEIYGIETATEMKRKLREFRKGKSFEELLGEEKAKVVKEKFRNARIGKTYEEIFGKERAKEIKKKQSAPSERKGKTYEELFGKEKATEWNKKHSDSIKGEKNYMFGRKHTDEVKKICAVAGAKSMKGKIPWNKGLTKETDDRIHQISLSQKKTWRERKLKNEQK